MARLRQSIYADFPSWRLANALQRSADNKSPLPTALDKLRKYQDDPIGFSSDIFGFVPWEVDKKRYPQRTGQADLIRAVLKSKRVAWVSGHKCGKSTALALLALWFFCSFPAARVVITAATSRQVNSIIWREIKRLVAIAAKRGHVIPGTVGLRGNATAASGITDPSTLAEIRGFTATEKENIAGTSGEHLLYLLDEASGISDDIFEALEGNRAAGAHLVMISNPTKASGEFYEAFHSKADYYKTGRISSRWVPNVTGFGPAIPGLAGKEWIEEKDREEGANSAWVKIRIDGEFSVAEESRIFPLGIIQLAQERYLDRTLIPESMQRSIARVRVGVDPAGDGDGGDESAFAVKRDAVIEEVSTRRGLTPEGHIAVALDLALKYLQPGDPLPILAIDSEGEVGAKVWSIARAQSELPGARFEVMRVRSSEKAIRQVAVYDRIRDELAANLRQWLRDGGALPQSEKLERELHALEFASDARGRLKLTPKKTLRKTLGRSPDSADACMLACWESLVERRDAEIMTVRDHRPAEDHDYAGAGTMDPYSAAGQWR